MASLFRPRRPEEHRPSQPGGATWLSGLVSGAGRLISSVFGPDTPSPSSSCSLDSDEDEDTLVSSKELDAVNQSGMQLEVVKDCMEGSLAIVSKVEPKHAIEQLIMQETFSRDEYIRLTKIIQSRVVDCSTAGVVEDGVHKGLTCSTSGNAISFPGSWRSLNQATKQPELISCSPYSLNALSFGSSSHQLHTPEIHSAAVIEAKKWLEEKNLASSSKSDLGCGPRISSTDMLHHDLEGKVSSPVDVAKSYMQSLLPWRSLSLNGNEYESTHPGGMHFYKDGTPKATGNSLPPLKVLKRNSLGLGPQEAHDETRRVRLKLTDYTSEFPTFKQFDSSAISLKNEACKTSSEPIRRCQGVLDTLHESSFLQAAPVEDNHLDGALGSHDATAAGGNDPLETSNVTSTDIVSDPGGVVTAKQSTHENSVLEPIRPVVGNKFRSHDPATKIDESHSVEELSQVRETVAGDFVSKQSTHENSVLKPIRPVIGNEFRSHDPATKIDESHSVEEPSQVKETVAGDFVSRDSFVLALTSSEHAGKRSRKGNVKAQKKTNGSTNNNTVDSLSGLNTNPHVGSKEDHHRTDSSKVEPAAGVSKQTRGTTTPRGSRASKTVSRPRNGTTMKSIEQVVAKPEPRTNRSRGKEAVVRPRRSSGRGRGRGK